MQRIMENLSASNVLSLDANVLLEAIREGTIKLEGLWPKWFVTKCETFEIFDL